MLSGKINAKVDNIGNFGEIREKEITTLGTVINEKQKEITNLKTTSQGKDLLLADCQNEIQEMKRKLEAKASSPDAQLKEPKIIQYLNEELFKSPSIKVIFYRTVSPNAKTV